MMSAVSTVCDVTRGVSLHRDTSYVSHEGTTLLTPADLHHTSHGREGASLQDAVADGLTTFSDGCFASGAAPDGEPSVCLLTGQSSSRVHET